MATTKQNSTSNTSSSSQGGNESWGYGGSSSSTIGGSSSSTFGGSSSSTVGGSHSESNSTSQGGSQSHTEGSSQSLSQSQGGSTGASVGKSWASGQVAERTQENYDKSTQEYQQSAAVQQAYANLQSAISGKPAFQSQYEDQLRAMYDQIMNRDKFNYNFNEDQMYQQYKDMYTRQGRAAMQDTMGQAAALTGGYNSSYAQTAGQQTYQNYLQQLNDMIPQLRQQAYEEYKDEGEDLMRKYGLTQDAYNTEYGQYRDAMSDWQTDRTFNQGVYSDERNFDYSKYQGDRSFWQNQYWQERNSEQSNMSQNNQNNWSNALSNTVSSSDSASTNWSNTHTSTDTSSWSNTETSSWSNTDTSSWSNTDTSNWSHNIGTNWNTSNSSTNTTSTGRSSDSSAKYTADWGHNTAPQGITSGDLTRQLYQIYQSEGSQGLNDALGDLRQNGIKMGDTQYKFSDKAIRELQSELSSQLDNIYRYSSGNAGYSYGNYAKNGFR